MRTNIVLNDALIQEAFLYDETIETKRELIEVALQEYVDKLVLAHNDKDFIRTGEVVPELKLFSSVSFLS